MRLKIFLFITLIYSFLQGQNIDCYTIAVGKNASAYGFTLMAHNEDDYGNKIVNLFRVPELQTNTQYLPTKVKPQNQPTISYLWFETTQENFGDFLINDYGVSICSNACRSKEDTATGILKFDFRHLIIRQAKTAKQAVKIAGRLIETYGYGSSGRTYCIADKDEIWLLAVVKGKHWVAQKVPDDQVAIIPNYYTIDTINLSDTNNFLGSKDIITYAIKRHWYNPKTDGKFSFRKAYSDTRNLYAFWNVPRHWIGLNLLANKEFSLYDNFPFSFKPKQKISIEQLMKVLSNHYENTDFQTDTTLHPNPHKHLINRICNYGTKFSIIVQYSDPLKNTIIWWAPLNPCINPYLPIVLSIREFPEYYHNRNYSEAFSHHFDTKGNKYEDNPDLAFSVFEKYTKQINENYWQKIPEVQKYKQRFYLKSHFTILNSKVITEVSKRILEDYYNQIKEKIKE